MQTQVIEFIVSQFSDNRIREDYTVRNEITGNPMFENEIVQGYTDEISDLMKVVREHLNISRKEITFMDPP
jgi:hypothetical protein